MARKRNLSDEALSAANAVGGRAAQATRTPEERVRLARQGGLAKSASMTDEQKREWSIKANEARWGHSRTENQSHKK